MKKMSFGIAFFFILVSCYVLFSARSFPGQIDNVPGPGYFPTILSIVLIVLSLLLLATSGNASNVPLGIFSKEKRLVLVAGGITIVYLGFLAVLGFLVATPLYLIAIFRYFKMKNWRSVLLTAILTTAVSYGVFTTVLEVQLPSGLF